MKFRLTELLKNGKIEKSKNGKIKIMIVRWVIWSI